MGKQYKIDSEKSKRHVYANDGKGPNPYDEGTRIYRLWEKHRVFYLNMESHFDELSLVYGEFRPDRL